MEPSVGEMLLIDTYTLPPVTATPPGAGSVGDRAGATVGRDLHEGTGRDERRSGEQLGGVDVTVAGDGDRRHRR